MKRMLLNDVALFRLPFLVKVMMDVVVISRSCRVVPRFRGGFVAFARSQKKKKKN